MENVIFRDLVIFNGVNVYNAAYKIAIRINFDGVLRYIF